MAFNPFRPAAPPMRAHVIRVAGATASLRLAVLAPDPAEALAAVIADLGLNDIAEITDEVLPPATAARLGLEPGRPLRLT